MGLYEQAAGGDLIGPVRDLLDRGIVYLDDQGRFQYVLRAFAVSGPWIIVRAPMDRLCAKWFEIYWQKYRHLSKGCRGCWKIVAKVKNLEQLWKVYKLQQKLDLPGKCGMDRREWTFGVWSAFWYCPIEGGLEGARSQWKRVQAAVHEECDPEIEVILKRGCTEMEAEIGPSDQWRPMSQEQEVYEQLLDSAWPDGKRQRRTPMIVRMHYFAKWVRWAWAHGDPTVFKFIEHPLLRPLVEYQTSVHSPADFPVPMFDREIIGAVDDECTESDPSCFKVDSSGGPGSKVERPRIAKGIALVS